MRYYTLALFFAPLATVLGAAVPTTSSTPNIPAGYNHYATFTEAEIGLTFGLHANKYVGPALVLNSTNYNPKHAFTTSNGNTAVTEPDICQKAAEFFGTAVDSATTLSIFLANAVGDTCLAVAGGVYTYFTANNYANLNTVLQGGVVGFVDNIASTPIGNAMMNSEHSTTKSSSSSNACNIQDREFLADNYASAVGQFCQAIKAAKSQQTETHFMSADVSGSNHQTDKGAMAMTKAFIAVQGDTFGLACAAIGITWKRWLGLE